MRGSPKRTLDPNMLHSEAHEPTRLTLEDVHAWYGESHVLHGVSLRIGSGQVVSLLGRNGAGKTTTLRAIMGVIGKQSGSITFDGRQLNNMPRHRIPRLGIGYVPDERGIFSSLTVDENLMLPPVVQPGGMALEEIYQLFPNLLGRGGTRGTRLSGGEQQMLSIARILRTGCNMILLDEPSEGLAPALIQQIGAAIRRLKTAGYTLLLVEQNFKFAAAISDLHYVMEEGRIVDRFTSDEVGSNLSKLNSYLGI